MRGNDDGSIDLYLQKDFIPKFHLCWPKENPLSILDSSWWSPMVQKN